MNILWVLSRLRKVFGLYSARSALLKSLCALAVGFWVHAAFYKVLEAVDWWTAIWVTWATFSTVGYGDVSAGTLYGKLTTMLVGTAGIAVLANFFGAFVEYKINLRDRRRLGLMKNTFKGSYVIFNFPNEFTIRAFMEEILAVEPDATFCIVDGRLAELPHEMAGQENVCFIKGRILDQSTYERANLAKSKTVIVFPVEPTVPDSDATTLTVTHLVERFVGEETRIIHVLVDPNNRFLFEQLRSVAVQESLEIFALVQECQDPFSSVILEKMLRNTEGANPHTVTLQRSVGLTWAELQVRSVEVGARLGINVNALALIRDNEVRTCPDFGEKIKSGDRLSILAHSGFDWPAFEAEMTS